jgi:ribosomal protein S27E
MKPLRERVTFRKTPLPHARHVAELGATCTTCHSADTHKRLAATPATCASCHHSPGNERCEDCHREQTAFYRATPSPPAASAVKLEPNSMAAAVGCTGCHDMTKKHSRAAVGEKCLACHDKSYEGFVTEWTTGLDAEVKKTAAVVATVAAEISKSARAGRKSPEAERLLKEARDALTVVRRARGAHNPPAAEALLTSAREKAATARAALAPAR